MSAPSADQIAQAVAEAVEEAKAQNEGGGRLLPFTDPELRFISRVVEGALARALAAGGA